MATELVIMVTGFLKVIRKYQQTPLKGQKCEQQLYSFLCAHRVFYEGALYRLTNDFDDVHLQLIIEINMIVIQSDPNLPEPRFTGRINFVSGTRRTHTVCGTMSPPPMCATQFVVCARFCRSSLSLRYRLTNDHHHDVHLQLIIEIGL
eukprot:sb/3473682/